MECPYCKADNREGVRYCGNCGKLIAASSTGGPITTNSSSLAPGARVQGGRYIIKSVLGQGGMGAALLATDVRLDGKAVVIKELISDNVDPNKRQDDVRNFKREVSMLAHIDHPLIPNVTDHFQEGSRYFMVQEFVDGENLEERMKRVQQPMLEREALICASEILDVLDYLGQQTPPIIHRDIKPANIIIGAKDRRAHLVDFGIARADEAKNVQRKQTSALGTPGYAPPEQYQGNADPRSDLYALAATLHHLLTNRDPRDYPPFTYPPLRSLNPQLAPETERVLTRALQNDINQRYQSAAAMKQEIDDILRQRYGISGNISSYAVGTSGAMPRLGSAGNPPSLGGIAPMPDQSVTQQPTVLGTPYSLPTTPSTLGNPPTAPAASYVGNIGTPPILPPPPYPGGPAPQQFNPIQPAPYSVQKRRRSPLLILLLLFLLLLLIGGSALATSLLHPGNNGKAAHTTPTVTHVPANPLTVTTAGKDLIGISDGSYTFDSSRADSSYKRQATNAFQKNHTDTSTVSSLLKQALNIDTNDAEALIYLENIQVLNSGSPYITVVVGTMFSQDTGLIGVSRDALQGVYVAQKEFNDGNKLHGGTQVRVLIANAGGDTLNATKVAQQIVELKNTDKTFVGVMGWLFSSRTLQALTPLQQAGIPMVSSTASSDDLTNASKFFFRVAPSNDAQASAGAGYAIKTLKVQHAALFIDPADSYSRSLGNDFAQHFKSEGGSVVDTENYTEGKPAELPDKLNKALQSNPDMIYFAGYANDVSTLLINLPDGNMPVLGGDALYELGGYAKSAHANFGHLRFTSFAHPDEWDALGYTKQKPAFFREYADNYNPTGQLKSNVYGFTRPDNDVILGYDATEALLIGCNNALKATTHPTITPADVDTGLQQISGKNGFQGVSGSISFGSDGNPVNKAVVLLKVTPEGYIQVSSVLNTFLQAQ